MHPKSVVNWVLCLTLLTIIACKAGAQSGGYAVTQAYALHQYPNGIDGTLQLLTDSRLTASVQDQLWGKGDWSFIFPPGAKLHDEFSVTPPRRPKLVIADTNGKVVVERELETPLAKLEAWNPTPHKHELFLLSQDYSVGAGSYNGQVTTLFEVSDAGFLDIKALNTESKQEEPIRLAKSLKSDWVISDRIEGREILSVSCKPHGSGDFVVDYIRYTLEDGRWVEHRREVSGFWESDQLFPDRSMFP